jgi:hypothetical protein
MKAARRQVEGMPCLRVAMLKVTLGHLCKMWEGPPAPSSAHLKAVYGTQPVPARPSSTTLTAYTCQRDSARPRSGCMRWNCGFVAAANLSKPWQQHAAACTSLWQSHQRGPWCICHPHSPPEAQPWRKFWVYGCQPFVTYRKGPARHAGRASEHSFAYYAQSTRGTPYKD